MTPVLDPDDPLNLRVMEHKRLTAQWIVEALNAHGEAQPSIPDPQHLPLTTTQESR